MDVTEYVSWHDAHINLCNAMTHMHETTLFWPFENFPTFKCNFQFFQFFPAFKLYISFNSQ
jgi:hypothetical protein